MIDAETSPTRDKRGFLRWRSNEGGPTRGLRTATYKPTRRAACQREQVVLVPDAARPAVYVYDNFFPHRHGGHRHCCGSTFHIETTFQCITNIVIP